MNDWWQDHGGVMFDYGEHNREYTLITRDGKRIPLDPESVMHIYDRRGNLVGYEYHGEDHDTPWDRFTLDGDQ